MKAVVAVDLYGQCADYAALSRICDAHGVVLIEDAAESLGAEYGSRPAGSFGLASVFSFNGNKMITTSGGGMIVTDDAVLAQRSRFLATQAREPAAHYEHRDVGYNYRLSNLLAALGRGQLVGLGEKVAARRRTNRLYQEALSDVPGIQFMPVPAYGRPTFWLTALLIDAEQFGASRDAVLLHMAEHGIEVRPTWKPMHLQPVFAALPVVGGEVSADVFARGLCLPSGSGLTDRQRDRVVSTLLRCPRRARSLHR